MDLGAAGRTMYVSINPSRKYHRYLGKRYKQNIAVPEMSEAGFHPIRRIRRIFCFLSLTGVVPRMPGAFVPISGDAPLYYLFGGIYEHTNPFYPF